MIQKFKKLFILIIFIQLSFLINYNTTNAATSTWNFDLLSNYTLSNTWSFTLASWLWRLSLNFNHVWSLSNSTILNGAYDLIVEGNYAYMTSYLWDRFIVVDISTPSTPVIVANLANNNGTLRLNWAAWLVKNWNYIYIASRVSDAIQIINVTTPTAPVAAWNVLNSPTSNRLNWARAITILWTKMYVASDVDDSLTVWNITNPVAPTKLWEYQHSTYLNWVRDVKISWNYAFVSSYVRDNIAVIDISVPATPTFVTEYRDTTNLNGAWWIKIIWTHAYVSGYLANAVQIIDISTPSSPTLVSTINNSLWLTLTNPRDIAVSGNILYIAWYWSNNINAVDVSTPSSPVFINTITNSWSILLWWAYWVFQSWLNVYAASYTSDAIEIMNLRYDTTSPTIIPNTAFTYTWENLTSFSNTLSLSNSWSITYQISKNNWTTWYYWNWSAWVTTVLWVTNSNSASIIDSNISSFDALAWWTSQFKWKAFFTSNWTQKTEINTITVTSVKKSPWWVSTNLLVWLKANKWTSTTTDWASLTTWNDQSWNWYNISWWVSPTYLNNSSTWNINFNPYVNFNWSQYLDNNSNWANSRSYFMVIVPNNLVNWSLSWQVPFWWECTSWVLSSWTCWLAFAGTVLWSFTVAITDEVITHALWSSLNWRSAQVWAVSYPAWNPMLLWFNENSSVNWTDIYEKWIKIDNYTANTYQTLSTANFRLWRSMDTWNPFPYNWKIAEVINYSSRVSDSNRQKIESYLAFKYWITLNNWTQNYLASDWTTTIWGTGSAWLYIYNIFGIWRDDWSELWQVKSRSMNTDWVITLEAIWEWTNALPSYVDITDKEFFTVSNAWWSNTWTQSWTPVWYDILTRKWKIQEVWDIWTINIDFDVANANFDIPLLSSWSNYYFILDTNTNWLLSDETPQIMTNTSWNIWRIAWTNPSNGQIFTLASISSSNNIPTNITLSNNIINENVAIWTTIWTLTTTDADPGDTHTYSLVVWVWDTDNASFSITWSTLKISVSPDYELKNTYSIRIQTNDWNWWQYQKQFTININEIWESINSILDFEIAGKYTVTSWIWTRTTWNPQQWTYSIESDNLWAANSQSCFEVTNTLYTGTWTVEFQYNVSSETNDYLRFYIDNVQQQQWSWTVPWALYSKNDVVVWVHNYKWCYIKDWATNGWSDKAWIDYITFRYTSTDSIPPIITSINYASWSLLPWWNHNLIINYNDLQSWINTSSDIITLQKWNWSSWWVNMASTWLNLTWKTVTATVATYPTNNLLFWKYLYNFQISDNYSNSSSTWAVFYIDQPELIVSTWSFDAWNLSWTWLVFSTNEIVVTLKTVWAWFQVLISKDSNFQTSGGSIIIDWNWTKWVWYDKSPYTLVNKNINSNQTIWTWATNININWLQNTYTYNLKIWDLVDLEQAAGDYSMNLSFRVILNY